MKNLILLFVIIISISKVSIGQYCYPSSTNLFASHQIQYFQIGDFINITPDTNILEYNDFSDSLIIYVEIGKQYLLVMSKEPNPYGPIAGNTLGYSIWVDFNNDTIFSASELIYSQYYSTGSVYTYVDTIQFTDTLLSGNRRLRVRNEWGAAPNLPCDALWGGETEDYTINFSPGSFIIIATCYSYTVPSGNETYTTSGTYLDTIPNAAGGDSIITINLTINNDVSSTIAETACYSYISPGGNYTWTASATYMDTIPSAAGCDSIITINLTINNDVSSTITETACDSYTSPGGNYTWTASGTYTDTIPSAAGCDSVITINLIITNSTSSTIAETACDSYTSPGGNYIWTASATYMDTIPSTAGCDSVITINLTITNSTSSTITETACNSYTSPSGNYAWTNSGTYVDSISNAAGCDSIITVNLTINTVNTSVTPSGINLTANTSGAAYQWLDCDSENTTINGETNQYYTATANGNYAVEITQNGCVDTSDCYTITGVRIIENHLGASLTLYPNPTRGSVIIDLDQNYNNVTVIVRNVAGQVVSTQNYGTTDQLSMEIKGSKGIYLIEIRTDDGKEAFIKILKQ